MKFTTERIQVDRERVSLSMVNIISIAPDVYPKWRNEVIEVILVMFGEGA